MAQLRMLLVLFCLSIAITACEELDNEIPAGLWGDWKKSTVSYPSLTITASTIRLNNISYNLSRRTGDNTYVFIGSYNMTDGTPYTFELEMILASGKLVIAGNDSIGRTFDGIWTRK